MHSSCELFHIAQTLNIMLLIDWAFSRVVGQCQKKGLIGREVGITSTTHKWHYGIAQVPTGLTGKLLVQVDTNPGSHLALWVGPCWSKSPDNITNDDTHV